MALDDNTYILTEEDTSWDSGDEAPEIRAARNPDPRVLSAVLKRPRRPTLHPSGIAPNPANTFDRCNTTLLTPLIMAVKKQLPANIRLLLDQNANVDGFDWSVLNDYAKLFPRFPNRRGTTEAARVPSQATPITTQEIEHRHKNAFCPFWQGPGSCPWHFYRGGDGITAIEEACKHSSIEIFEMIISASPDVSFWTDLEAEIPETTVSTPSSLSVSNPLICAVKYRQIAHLRRLLDLGFNPNSTPVVGCFRSYSPLMATFLCCNPPNWDAFSLLLVHSSIDRGLLTPLTRVHILHMVVSLLSLDTLQRVLQAGFSLSTVNPTAFGHTLLHVACLPLQITHVNIFMESIYQSAREFRQLGFSDGPQYIIFEGDDPRPQPTEFFAAQTELASFLLSEIADPNALIAAQDCHGNTALHYLAMHRTINWELLDMLISSSDAAQDTYYETRNMWDWSAENLVRHGEVSDSEIGPLKKSFWNFSHTARIDEKGRIVPIGIEE